MNWILRGFLVVSLFSGCGRTASRFLGKGHRQVLEIDHMQRFISISFDKRGGSTVKDVTYRSTDGYIYTVEFKDISPLEGRIRWVPHGGDSSLIQSRTLSRWFGTTVDLELPKDCARVLGVDVGYAEKGERVKNLTCRMSDGRIMSREYREGLIDRHFSGWLEIRRKK